MREVQREGASLMPVHSSGMDELRAKLKRLQRLEEDEGIAKKALEAGAKILRDEIERRAPRSKMNKKHLADNVIISSIIDGRIDIGFHRDFFYAQYLEWGTSKMPAQPFVEPAFIAVEGQIIDAMMDVYEREFAKL